jgi:hypothetical protein
MTHRDRVGGSSGRRKVAGDAVHRQNFSTPPDGPHTRPERRLTKAFGRRRARFAMPPHRHGARLGPKTLVSRLYGS